MKKISFCFSLIIILCSHGFGQLSVVSAINGPAQVCSGTMRTYTATANNSPTLYVWTSLPPGYVTIAPSGSVANVTFLNLGAVSGATATTPILIRCHANNTAGTGVNKNYDVTIFSTPHVGCTGNTICRGLSTTLTANAWITSTTSPVYYSWVPALGLNTTTNDSVIAGPQITTIYTITSTNGPCSFVDTATVFVEPCVGLTSNGKIEGTDLLVYPNPNNGTFTLKSFQPEVVNIINGLGQLIQMVDLVPDIETNMDGLLPGIYFINTAGSCKKIIVSSK